MITRSACKKTLNASLPEKVTETVFSQLDITGQKNAFQRPMFSSRNIHLLSRNYTIAKHSQFNSSRIKL
jgi:hypothetical protein